jgi:septal ring-binding cell division protein DamX
MKRGNLIVVQLALLGLVLLGVALLMQADAPAVSAALTSQVVPRTATGTPTGTPMSTALGTRKDTATSTGTPTGTPPAGRGDSAPDALPLLACGVPQVVTGSITSSDPGHANWIVVSNVCGGPATCTEQHNALLSRYDVYTFTNPDALPRQVTVDVTLNCGTNARISSNAYLGSYDPANLCTNILGGSIQPVFNGPPSGSYTFNVPANATFVIDVGEINNNAGCASYTLTVTTQCTACATSTPTKTPTLTPTATPTSTPAPCGVPQNYNGSITNSDPSHTNYISATGVCGGPPSCELFIDQFQQPFHYDLYPFTNPDPAPRQVTVNVGANCGDGVSSYAYLGSYDPANL